MTTQRIGPPVASVRALELDGEISLYHAASQQAVLLNDTASAIWRLADGQRSLREIVTDLAATYGTTEDQIRPDVERAVAELVAAGFLPAAAPDEASPDRAAPDGTAPDGTAPDGPGVE